MGTTLTRQERETVITFNEADSMADVFTYNPRMLRELKKLAVERPNDVHVVRGDNGMGAATFTVPKKWVKIRASRILTEAQRMELSKRGKEHGFRSSYTAK